MKRPKKNPAAWGFLTKNGGYRQLVGRCHGENPMRKIHVGEKNAMFWSAMADWEFCEFLFLRPLI